MATLALLTAAVPASAEIVFLKSGRTLSVKSHKVDGERITLTLRGGGEVTCDKTVIDKIEADEVPYIEPPIEKVEKVEQIQETPVAGLPEQDRPVLDGTPYAEIIAAAAEAHGVDPMLVRALIQVESGYRPRARSPRGAMGLMQLMPSTAREYNVRHPFEPKANIEAGIKHLKTLIDRFGDDVGLALAAYNAGPGAVEKFNGIPPYRETRSYVSRILALAGLK
ncbi:MAG: lytic transglycosylase domain-containing protein [Acidobacteriota bacterium]|nr:lytic transglycosylase domain-containing protein [Acidobacteriota bacterium]